MKKIILLIFLTCYGITAFSQSGLHDSIVKARDFIAATFIYSSLKDMAEDPKTNPVDVINFKRIKGRLEQNSLEHPISNEALMNLLRTNGYTRLTQIFLPEVSGIYLADTIDRSRIGGALVGAMFNISSRAIKSPTCFRIRDSVIREVDAYFYDRSDAKQIPGNSETSADKPGGLIEIDRPVDTPSSKWMYVVLATLIMLSFVLLVGFFLKRRSRPGLEESNSVSIDASIVAELPVRKQKKVTVQNPPREAEPAEAISDFFYMPLPDRDVFFGRKAANERTYESVFSFTMVSREHDLAEFTIIDSEVERLVRDKKTDGITSACYFEGGLPGDFDSVKIICTMKGTARIEKGNWIIITPVHIAFKSIKPEKSSIQPEPEMPELGDSIETIPVDLSEPQSEYNEAVRNYVTFYMGVPEANLFRGTAMFTAHKHGITLFEFKQEEGSAKAFFSIVDDGSCDQLVKNSSLYRIQPACDFDSLTINYTGHVVTNEAGEARLENQNWRIIKRAKIEFK